MKNNVTKLKKTHEPKKLPELNKLHAWTHYG